MKKILIFLLLIASLTANAEKWYIATAANGGDDTDGDGSETAPWLTLKHACDTITGAAFVGDTIVVGEGTFTETAQSALGVGVSIYGAGETSIITTGAALDPIIELNSASEGTDGSQSISYIKIDGDLTAIRGITVFARSNVLIHHCWFLDFGGVAIGSYTSAIDMRGLVSGTGEPTTYATGNEIYNCDFSNCSGEYTSGAYKLAYGAILINGQEGLEIHDNTIDEATGGRHGYGIKGVALTFHKGLKIYDNTITCGAKSQSSNQWSFAIELWDCRGGLEIYNNTFTGGFDLGGYYNNDAGGYGYAAKIYNNTSSWGSAQTYTHSWMKIEGDVSGGVYVYNNFVQYYSNAIGFSNNNSSHTVRDIYIYYNLLNNCFTASGNYTGKTIEVSSVANVHYRNLQFLNNVMYNSTYICTSGIASNEAVEYFDSIMVKNNIFINHLNTIYFRYATIDSIWIQNNYYDDCTSWITYTECTVTNNTETNNTNGDPLFVSATDFHLQSTSPCRDAGIDVSAITGGTDFHGASLYGAAYDIGAFEYGANRILKIDDTTLPTINYKVILIDH